jgi:hypothetical protein
MIRLERCFLGLQDKRVDITAVKLVDFESKKFWMIPWEKNFAV